MIRARHERLLEKQRRRLQELQQNAPSFAMFKKGGGRIINERQFAMLKKEAAQPMH